MLIILALEYICSSTDKYKCLHIAIQVPCIMGVAHATRFGDTWELEYVYVECPSADQFSITLALNK